MSADADDRAFVDSVDVQGNTVGLLDVEGLKDTFSTGHGIHSLSPHDHGGLRNPFKAVNGGIHFLGEDSFTARA
jgi:hypothetical protein